MLNLVKHSVVVIAVAAGLSGCVLAPQTISLNENANVTPVGMMASRDALVRVVDKRDTGDDVIGHRGGRLPENSPLLASRPVSDALTSRLQSSLKSLGFGDMSGMDPLKVQLDIRKFSYECNEGVVVNKCTVRMDFMVTVLDGEKTFTKPYQTYETRSLAASPVAEYNQKWVNEVLDNLWNHMFTDAELLGALQVGR